jgi:hypothetical protein
MAINRSEASKEQRRQYARSIPLNVKAYRGYKHKLKVKYGMTFEEYEALLKAQNGVCAVCQRPETVVLKKQVIRLAVDHSHSTGKVRGLLCRNCNAALGFLNDDILRFQAAIDYLRKYGTV